MSDKAMNTKESDVINNLDKIKVDENLNKGYLIRLKCGHNVFLKGNDEKILVQILEKEGFFK